MPFWRSMQPWRHPLSFAFTYEPRVNILNDHDDVRLLEAVHDSLRVAKIHQDGTSRGPIRLGEIGMFLVDVESETILRLIERGLLRELVLKGPVKAITEIENLDRVYHPAASVASTDWRFYNRILMMGVATKVKEAARRFSENVAAVERIPLATLRR